MADNYVECTHCGWVTRGEYAQDSLAEHISEEHPGEGGDE